MKTLSRSFYVVAALLVLVAGTAAISVAQDATSLLTNELDQPLKPITPDDERLTGLIKPSKRVQLMAPREGIVAKINVEEDDKVTESQVLAQMDDTLQIVAIDIAKLDIDSKQALLEEAKLQVEQIERLFAKGATTEHEVRQRKLQQTIREIDLATSRAEHDQQQRALETLYKVKAPFNGRIVKVDAEAGAKLQHDDVVLEMIALDPLEAQMFLPVQLYGELEVGKPYTFHTGPPVNRNPDTRVITGKLKSIEPVIEPASQTFRCVFTIENPDEKLPAGFTVRLAWPQP